MRVLVTGATGFVGSRLVPELIDAGHDVCVLVRDAGDYDPPDGVRVFEGDVLEPGSFEGALEDCEAVYYLIHSMGGGGDFAERDRRAARNVSRAASEGDVDRLIYLSGLGGDGDLSDHLRSRREVEYVLGEGEFDLTALRAAVVIGADSASFRMIRQLADRLPLMVTPEWVRTECQPIAVDDVVSYLVGVLDVPETAGGTYQVGGPEVLTYREMLEETARLLHGRKPLIVPVPVLTPTLSAYWVDLVTDVPADVAHPLIDGLGNQVVVTDDSIEELVPVKLTTFEDAVRRAIDEDGEEEPRPNRAAGSSDRGAVPVDEGSDEG